MKKKISIIIPVKDGENFTDTIDAIKKANYNLNKVEIFIVSGNNPSLQRNEAVKKSVGDIIYFLDNDSKISPENLNLIEKFFKEYPDAGCIGGPSLPLENDSFWQKALSIALGSFFGSSFSRARYTKIGKIRKSSELELILCNMAFKKETFIKNGMFNPNLYPNEENELLNKLKKNKDNIYYIPELIVYRSHRKNLIYFIKQIFRYGRGRAEQTFINIKNLTLFPLISLLFDLYILFLLITNPKNSYLLLPFFLYIILNIFISFYKAIYSKNIFYFSILPFIYFIIHTVYGIGFFYGIIKSIFFKKKDKKWYFKIKKLVINRKKN